MTAVPTWLIILIITMLVGLGLFVPLLLDRRRTRWQMLVAGRRASRLSSPPVCIVLNDGAVFVVRRLGMSIEEMDREADRIVELRLARAAAQGFIRPATGEDESMRAYLRARVARELHLAVKDECDRREKTT